MKSKTQITHLASLSGHILRSYGAQKPALLLSDPTASELTGMFISNAVALKVIAAAISAHAEFDLVPTPKTWKRPAFVLAFQFRRIRIALVLQSAPESTRWLHDREFDLVISTPLT